VPIDYVTAALDKLKKGKAYRGDAGVVGMLVPLGEATRNFRLPADAAAAAAAARPARVGGTPKVIVVKTINPRAPAAGIVKPGDVLFSADGVTLADDLFALDRIMDEHVNRTVPVVLYRNGERVEADMPTHDLEALKARRFARFAGGAFHDLTERTIYFTPVDGDGVMMAYSDAGTTLSSAAGSKAVITELNGEEIRNLDDFISAAKKVKHGQHGSFVHRNPNSPGEGSLDEITFDLRFDPLEVFKWDEGKLEWVKEE
jgi:S1-C subfamily serine protease